MTPRSTFRTVAVAEAVTWAALLTSMFVKYGTAAEAWGELAVSVTGMVHGVVFIAYCLVTLVVAVDQRWSPAGTVLGLVAAVPPFATLPFEAYAARRGQLGAQWLSRPDSPTALQRSVCWLLTHHRLAVGLLAAAVAGLTAVALLVGPPVG